MKRLSKMTKVYYVAAIISTLICWSPFKALAYVASFIVLFLLIFWGGDKRLLKRAIVWVFLWVWMVVIYGSVNGEFRFGNALVAFITWAGLIVLLIIPARGVGSPELLRRLEQIAWVILAVESVWGIVQGLYGYTRTRAFDLANGDYVEGTIHLQLEAGRNYSNVMFAINIALLLLFLLPALWRRPTIKKALIYMWGVVAFVMASVVHTILFLTFAGVVSALLVYERRPRLSVVFGASATLGFIALLSLWLLPRNLRYARRFALQIFRGEVPRSASVMTALMEMPKDYWYLPFIGLGPGQYASRAGLISTGRYFGGLDTPKEVPFLPNTFTESQTKYLLPLWRWQQSNPYFGSTQVPYFSWLAVYTEWGLVGWGAILAVILGFLRTVCRISQVYHVEKFVLLATIVFVFLLGFQENNWEVPQAWFSGLLFIKALYASSRYSLNRCRIDPTRSR